MTHLVAKAALEGGVEMHFLMKAMVHPAALVALVEKVKLVAQVVPAALVATAARMAMAVMVVPVALVVILPTRMWEKAALAVLAAPVDIPVVPKLPETSPAIPVMVVTGAKVATVHPTNPALPEVPVVLPARSLPLRPVIRLPLQVIQETQDMVALVVVEAPLAHKALKAHLLLSPVVKHPLHHLIQVEVQLHPHRLEHPAILEHHLHHLHHHAVGQITHLHHHLHLEDQAAGEEAPVTAAGVAKTNLCQAKNAKTGSKLTKM